MTFRDRYTQRDRAKMLEAYAGRVGYYLLSFDGSLLLAYICDDDNYRTLNLCGNAIFVQYFEGDMEMMLQFLDPNQVEYILFHRKGVLKRYPIGKFLTKAL